MTTPPAPVGIVGLGKMGLPMARHLLAAGFAVHGYDIRPAAAAALSQAGGVAAASPAGVAAAAEIVITAAWTASPAQTLSWRGRHPPTLVIMTLVVLAPH